MFNSFFGVSNSNSNSYNFLSDYASIKNGSYGKLMNSYYKGNSNVNSLVSNNSNMATSKESAKKLTSIQDAAGDLKEKAEKLYTKGKNSVFNKVDKKDEDGNVTKEYDTDAIYKSVNSFVKSYNDLIDSTKSTDSNSLNRAVDNLKSLSKSQSKMLESIGIAVKSDGTLDMDSEAFKKADMSKVESMFSGSGSYAYQVSNKASMVNFNAQKEAAKANTYNQFGSYNNNYNYSYNSFI